MYRKKSLRGMKPLSRKLAEMINEIHSIERRINNLIPEVQRIETWYAADVKSKSASRKVVAAAGMYCPTCRVIVTTKDLKCPNCGDLVQNISAIKAK